MFRSVKPAVFLTGIGLIISSILNIFYGDSAEGFSSFDSLWEESFVLFLAGSLLIVIYLLLKKIFK